jgi:hypothetical protein
MDRAVEASQQDIDRFQRAFGAFWEEIGDDRYAPMMRDMMGNVLRANLELVDWMGRSAKACAEVASDLARCRTPQDVFTSQERLLRHMMRDFHGTAARMLETWSDEFPPQLRKSGRK